MKIKKRYYKVENRSTAPNNRIITYFFIFIIFITGGIFIKLGIDTRKERIPIYNYSAEKSSNYEILLKPNEFYTTEILPSGKVYASKSINSIKINFKYDFIEDENVKIDYNITAELIGNANTNDNQNKEVWSRIFNLMDNKEISSGNSINEDINIDYEFFNNLSRSYEENYGIAINSILKVKLNVYYNINLSKFNLNNESGEDYIELDIPITNTITEVKDNYENKTNKDIFDPSKKINIKEISFYIIGGVLLIGAMILRIIIIKKNKTPEELYEKNINHILKSYKEIIVTVNNEPNLKNLEIMRVFLLEDLIDVAEQNKKNIIHYGLSKEPKSKLYVIVDKYAYMYIVTDKEIF